MRRAWLIWLVAACYFFYDYMHQVAPSVMSSGFRASFGADDVTIGLIASIYFYSYACLQIPIGLTVDHFGPRRPLTIAALVAAGFSLVFSFVDSSSMAIVVRCLIGAGAAFSFVSCLKLVSIWFPSRFAGSLVGLTNMVGMIGAIVAGAPLAVAVHAFGWRGTLQWLAGIGVVLAILIFLIVRDHPTQDELKHQRGLKKSWADVKHIFANPFSWLNGFYAASINLGFAALGALWGTSFLETVYHLAPVHAALINSMVFVGAIPGSLFFGWFSDWIKRRKLPMLLAALGAVIVMVLILYVHLPQWALYATFLCLGFFCSGNVVAYAYGLDIRPAGSAGVSLGFVNTCLIGGSALSQPIIGWLLQRSGQNFVEAFSLVIICLAISLVLALFIKETHCKVLHPDDPQHEGG